jgi:hypothetical protein
MERLNSLLEDTPSLHLYEHSRGEVLCHAAGTMHPSFRVFATSDPGRISGHKMSAALLNRVMRICLLPLDSGLTTDNADSHDAVGIVTHMFAGVSGGADLAALCVRFHAAVAQRVASGQLQLVGGATQVAARSLLHAAQGACHYLAGHPMSPAVAVVEALLKTYLSSLVDQQQQDLLLEQAEHFLQQVPQRVVYELAPEPAAAGGGEDSWQGEAKQLGQAAAQVQATVADLLWGLVPHLAKANVNTAARHAQQVSMMVACRCVVYDGAETMCERGGACVKHACMRLPLTISYWVCHSPAAVTTPENHLPGVATGCHT